MPESNSNPCACVLQFASLGILIAIVVLSSKVYNLTEKDPLLEAENINSNIGGNINLGHKYEKTNFGKHCQCGEEIVNDFCSEEQIIAGCFDVSLNKDKLSLRHLTMCDDANDYIAKNGGTINVAYKLNFDMVHKMSLGILIIHVAVLGSFVLILFSAIGVICCGECVAVLILPCIPIILIVILGSGIANLVLLIIMMVNYYQGYTTGDLIDYYNECVPANEKDSWKLLYKIDDLISLDKNMTALVVLIFIGMALNCLVSILSRDNKDK